MSAESVEANAGDHEPGLSAQWIIRYLEQGWSVLPLHSLWQGTCTCDRHPCPSPAKHPRVRWERWRAQAAPPDLVAGWWARWPDANVGVVTGLVSGVAVLDVDPRNGGDVSLAAFEDRWGPLPITLEVRTGGGGRHLWFRCDVPVASGPIAAGVDVKAEGGMVVVPPSVHVSGIRYHWRPGGEPGEIEPARLPDWVVERAPHRPGDEVARGSSTPIRTEAEKREFADTWSRIGIRLAPGDRYYVCPFHDDHRPSLHIDASGCRWFCFGCDTGGGIAMLRQMLGDRRQPASRGRLHLDESRGVPVTLDGGHEVDVVGESRHQDELLAITGGRRHYGGVDAAVVAELCPDPGNRFDPRAVEVRINGRAVGYLRRSDVQWLGPFIEDSIDMHGLATCRAFVRGGWDRGRGDVGTFGVVLVTPSPDE